MRAGFCELDALSDDFDVAERELLALGGGFLSFPFIGAAVQAASTRETATQADQVRML